MKSKLLGAIALALVVCCQYGHAQLTGSTAGYASAGYASAGSEDYNFDAVLSAEWQQTQANRPAAAQPEIDTGWGLGSGIGCDSPGGGCSASARGCKDAPSWQFFGDFLLLRARDAEVVYAVPARQGGTPGDAIAMGRLGTIDHVYEPSYRVGFTSALNDCASLGVTYTRFESEPTDWISTRARYFVRSTVAHPSTYGAGSDGRFAVAAVGLNLDLVDLDYRGMMLCSDRHTLNYLVGARYGFLQQGFFSRYAQQGAETMLTDVRFDGGGIRLGLEGERYLCGGAVMIYGRGTASFVAGEFDARYLQQNGPVDLVDAGFSAARVVPILDLELGIGWTTCGGRLRFAGGYLFSAWYNVLKTDNFIQAVQGNSFVELGDALTFDGLVVRAEYRF